MGRGLRIGTVAGAPVTVSAWWFLVAAALTIWIAPVYEAWLPGLGRTGQYLLAGVFVVLLWASTFLHELGHAWSARHFGLRVHSIELTALGGLTTMDPPPTATRSAVTSAAGPAVNVVLVVVAIVALNTTSSGTLPHLFAAQLAWTNALVAVFNLLPGLPLDGGAILRALVWGATGRVGLGTVVAAWSGRVIAVLAGLWFVRAVTGGGTVGAIWALLIAMWFWAASSAVLATERARSRIPDLSARDLARPFVIARADEPLSVVVDRVTAAGARAVVVVDTSGAPTGVVNEAAVSATPLERRPWVNAGAVSRRLEPASRLDAELRGVELVDAIAAAPADEYLVRSTDGSDVGVLAVADVEAALQRR